MNTRTIWSQLDYQEGPLYMLTRFNLTKLQCLSFHFKVFKADGIDKVFSHDKPTIAFSYKLVKHSLP